jgi:hypothetical protein
MRRASAPNHWLHHYLCHLTEFRTCFTHSSRDPRAGARPTRTSQRRLTISLLV